MMNLLMDKDEINYIVRLRKLRLARRSHKKRGIYVFFVCVVSAALAKIFPPIALLAVIKIVLYIRSSVKITSMKCPRCKKPFSTKAFILPQDKEVKDECVSCGLSMRLISES